MFADKRNLTLAQELTVGEVATRSGLAISTIHFYESKGLIGGWRTAGNRRRYPRNVLQRVAVIRVGQRLGISLSSIYEVLKSLPQECTPGAEDWRALLAHWRTDLDGRIAELMKLREQLASCSCCGCVSLESCPLQTMAGAPARVKQEPLG